MPFSRSEAFGILGIPADSDPETVARAYRQLARTTHPDVSDEPDAGHRFAALSAAFAAVSAPPGAGPVVVRPAGARGKGRADG